MFHNVSEFLSDLMLLFQKSFPQPSSSSDLILLALAGPKFPRELHPHRFRLFLVYCYSPSILLSYWVLAYEHKAMLYFVFYKKIGNNLNFFSIWTKSFICSGLFSNFLLCLWHWSCWKLENLLQIIINVFCNIHCIVHQVSPEKNGHQLFYRKTKLFFCLFPLKTHHNS